MDEVRSDLPIPVARNRGITDSLRRLVSVGQSVVVHTTRASLPQAIRAAGLTGKYAARPQPDGTLRVWRIKD